VHELPSELDPFMDPRGGHPRPVKLRYTHGNTIP
jgi:hypothetical protein